ncbi:MAG: filamentous hemagglutinin N-terminal domain-containing protein [Methylococcaceae bacterium]
MKPLSLLLAHIALILSYNAHAQVDTDGSMGEEKHLSGNMTIPQSLGTTSGHNLFHSFSHFNIDKNETVNFTGDNQLKNVISRVTGGEISKIDGVLKSEIGQANFYFINPAGIVFGTNASVDVPAAFHISTSDSLQFKDGQAFLASLTANNSSLSISEPTDFGFLGDKAGDITIKNDGQFVSDYDGSNYIGNHYDGTYLHFDHQNDVLLNAVNVYINNSNTDDLTTASILADPSGNITIDAKDNLNLTNAYIDNSSLSSSNAGQLTISVNNISLNNAAFQSNANNLNLDSTANAGIIDIKTKEDLTLSNYSLIDISSYSSGNAGQLSIDAKNINLDKSMFRGNSNTSIYPNLSNAGFINLKASQQITLNNESLIDANSYALGNAGQLIATAEAINLNNSSIDTNADKNTKANAGIITIKTNSLTISGDIDHTDSGIHNNTYDTTKSGLINIESNTISLKNTGAINTTTSGQGKASDIILKAHELTINTAGKLSSQTNSEGDAGTITINSENIILSSEKITNNSNETIIDSGTISSVTSNSGNAGNIIIQQAKNLTINQGGHINSSSNETYADNLGNAGSVSINSDKITNGGDITSISYSSGKGGSVTIQKAKELVIDGGVISTESHNKSDGGNIAVNSDQLTIKNNGHITAFTSGSGKAGDIVVQSNAIDISNNSSISAAVKVFEGESSSGQTGNIHLTANNYLSLNDNAQITIQNDATVTNVNDINTGLITISAPDISLNNKSQITTESTGNIGAGQLAISFAHQLKLSNDSNIITKTAIDNGGNVNIDGGGLIDLHNATINTYTVNNKLAVKGGDIKIKADILLMNNAQILSRAANAYNGGYADLKLKGIIASGNQLLVNGKTLADFESSQFTNNIIRTADSGWTTPQLNITGSISGLNRNIFELPDLNKGSCNDTTLLSSSLVHISKGGIPTSEINAIYIPPSTHVSTKKLQTAITPLLATHLIATSTPCSSLSL